jgi:hypothetical protein
VLDALDVVNVAVAILICGAHVPDVVIVTDPHTTVVTVPPPPPVLAGKNVHLLDPSDQ